MHSANFEIKINFEVFDFRDMFLKTNYDKLEAIFLYLLWCRHAFKKIFYFLTQVEISNGETTKNHENIK